MLLFLFYLIPILLSGIILLRKISTINRFELLIPAGSILGFAIFTFSLNLVSFLLKGPIGIITAYLLVISLGFTAFKSVRSETWHVDFPRGKQLTFWLLSILVWGLFIYWKSAYALIGSDTNLYYGIAHSFIKGNFPFLTPWQPDIPLAYHAGAPELLGAFYYFSNLDFQFLHLFFSGLFIFFAAQIIIWIIQRHETVASFLLANLAATVTFVSFGFIYITWPVFPIQLSELGSVNQLVLWLRNLPTVASAIEVYGAPINLDALIYFIFHAYGLVIFLSLLVLLLYNRKDKPLMGWVLICTGLASLALVNESMFMAAFPALVGGIFLTELREKRVLKSLRVLTLLLVLTILVVFFQGGIISASLSNPRGIQRSTVIFPKKEDVKEDFRSYHLGQISSKLLPDKLEWLPLRWFHPGAYFLLVFSVVAIIIARSKPYSVLLKALFIAGIFSLIAYNAIVPKFLVANGNRFLSTSFLFFSLILCISLIPLFEKIKSLVKKILFFLLLGWVFIPTILPPLALLTKQRFGENKLIPKYQQSSDGISWLKRNVNLSERVLVLDKNSPHPSGQERALVEAGAFAPLFSGNFRAFTIEASPEYVDIAYSLSPNSLKKLKVNILLVDNIFFESLPERRKQQLQDETYFEKVFDNSKPSNWEKIYRIKDKYLESGGELDGTLEQLLRVLPTRGKIYIDNEKNFNPSFLRRPLIFSLRDRDIYYLPQSGVYLNVEANINSHPPRKERDYDYLILGKNTNPEEECNCQTKLLWQGIRNEIYVWRKI
ncbi:hypothetical protein HYU45_02480 [Candidatus Daviesbacteria bacterium]|nr:hypothetical protein [Candidatus Daviesbacteria bacterium]